MGSPDYESPGQGGYIALTATGSDVADNEKVNLVLTIDLDTKTDVYGEIAKLIDASRTDEEREKLIEQLTKEMKAAAKLLEFEHAAYLRDRIKELQG